MNARQTRLSIGTAALLLLAACGGSVASQPGAVRATTAAPPVGSEPAVCAPLRAVYEVDEAMNRAMLDVVADLNSSGERAAFAELQAIIVETEPLLADVTASYADALRVAPADLRDDLSTLQEGTVVLWDVVMDLIIEADSASDFAASFEGLLEDPGFLEQTLATAAATLRLDAFTVPECGFQLSN